jgi:hypothetical protein
VEVSAVYPRAPLLQKIDTADPGLLGERWDIKHAQVIAAHESPRAARFYDRTMDDIMLDEGERLLS